MDRNKQGFLFNEELKTGIAVEQNMKISPGMTWNSFMDADQINELFGSKALPLNSDTNFAEIVSYFVIVTLPDDRASSGDWSSDWPSPGPVFCLLVGVSSGSARPITGQVTSVTWPVIVWAYFEVRDIKCCKVQ